MHMPQVKVVVRPSRSGGGWRGNRPSGMVRWSLLRYLSVLEQRVGKGYEGEPHKLLQI